MPLHEPEELDDSSPPDFIEEVPADARQRGAGGGGDGDAPLPGAGEGAEATGSVSSFGDQATTGQGKDESAADGSGPHVSQKFNVEEAGPGVIAQGFNHIFNFQSKGEGPKTEDEVSLIELTTALPGREHVLPDSVFEELTGYLQAWRREHLIFLSCHDEDLALGAAYALVERLGLPDGQRRVLDFDRAAKNNTSPNIFFLRREQDSAAEAAVVVDAAGEKSLPFLDTLLSATGATRFLTIHDDLKRANIYMLCLVDPVYMENKAGGVSQAGRRAPALRFAYWHLPFLRPLLRLNFPEAQAEQLEAQILEQRTNGWWSPDESDFYHELKRHIGERRLPEVVGARTGPVSPHQPNTLFKGDASLKDTVLYVAAFFPNLNPREFHQVVALLLKSIEEEYPPEAPQPGGEPPPARVWQKSPDGVLHDCHLKTSRTAKVVGFEDYRLKEELSEYIEDRHPLFHAEHFRRVHQLGLLISPSGRVAEGVMRLMVEMASAYPEDFGWLYLAETASTFDQALALEGGVERLHGLAALGSTGMLDPVRARRLFYQRLADFVRLMLNPGGLENAADAFLQQLINYRRFKLVFEMVKRLQLADGFDEFRWLRQLVDRSQEIRPQVFGYLLGYLKKVRARVYEILRSLERWLPNSDRPVNTYSASNWQALRLFLVYCPWTVMMFDRDLYGRWPTQYPLFAFKDAETAAGCLRMLTRWLFHPGMGPNLHAYGLNERFIYQFFELWAFILLGQEGPIEQPDDDAAPDGGDALNGRAVLDLLLKQVALNAGPEQQDMLLFYWDYTARDLLEEIIKAPHGSEERSRTYRRRQLIVYMAGRFKELRAEHAPSHA